MEKVAMQRDVENVLTLLDENGMSVFDVVNADGLDVIEPIDDAISNREDMLDCLEDYPDSQDYNDVLDDIDRMKDLKHDGHRFIYVYDNLNMTNGACDLVTVDALKQFKAWAINCIKGVDID